MNQAAEQPLSQGPNALGPSALGPCGAAVLVVAVLTLAAWAVGLPEGTAQFVFLGALLACGAGTLGCVVHLRAGRIPGGSLHSARQFQMALVLDFGFRLGAVAVGLVVLWLSGVKFPGLAGFGLSFAGASMAFQLITSVALARAWAQRKRAAPPSAGGSSAPDPLRRIPTVD